MILFRYLSTGDSFRTIAFSYRMHKSTVSKIISEICPAIWESLFEEYVAFPKSTDEWRNIAENFNSKWNYPHCLGAIDGKHVLMESPSNSGMHAF